jgi:hypothetical protein
LINVRQVYLSVDAWFAELRRIGRLLDPADPDCLFADVDEWLDWFAAGYTPAETLLEYLEVEEPADGPHLFLEDES